MPREIRDGVTTGRSHDVPIPSGFSYLKLVPLFIDWDDKSGNVCDKLKPLSFP